jgi:hypothetical protein
MDESVNAGIQDNLARIIRESQRTTQEMLSSALSAMAKSDTETALRLLTECADSIRRSALELHSTARNCGMKAVGRAFDRILKDAASQVEELIASLETELTAGNASAPPTAGNIKASKPRTMRSGRQSGRKCAEDEDDKSLDEKSRWSNPHLTLSKTQRDAVVEFMEKHDGAKTLEEIAQRHISEYSELITERLPNWYPGHSEEEYTAQALRNWLDSFLIDRGIARRLALNDPSELAGHASLAGRLEWMESRRNSESDYYPQVWVILRALGGGDLVVAKRFAETNRFPIAKGHSDVVPLYNGVLAVLRNDIEYLQSLVPILQKRKATLWIGATYPCLIGIAQNDAKLVADGLNRMARTCGRRQVYPSILEKTIYLELHGFFELCHWVSPNLVSEFNVQGAFPWDKELFQFVRTCGDPGGILRLEGVSPVLHRWLTTLVTPYWWD